MPRTKDSKNRPKYTTNSVSKTDYASKIAEKQETIVFLNTAEIASITASIGTKKVEAESVQEKLMVSGMSGG